MAIDPKESGQRLRDEVVAKLKESFPFVEVEIPTPAFEGFSAVFLKSGEAEGVEFELIVGADWSYSLFAGASMLADGFPMNESEADRITRIVGQIGEVAKKGLPHPTAGERRRNPSLRAAHPWPAA